MTFWQGENKDEFPGEYIRYKKLKKNILQSLSVIIFSPRCTGRYHKR
jgi:hypothetical protein